MENKNLQEAAMILSPDPDRPTTDGGDTGGTGNGTDNPTTGGSGGGQGDDDPK